MAQSEAQILAEYIRGAYPIGMRESAFTEGTKIHKYDLIRADAVQVFKDELSIATSRLVVEKSDEKGLLEWESFLKIPVKPSASIGLRKAEISTRLLGASATKKTIKTILDNLIGEDEYNLSELYKTSTNPDDVWTYIVSIFSEVPELSNYSKSTIKELLEKIHPAHCTLRVEINPKLKDSLGLNDGGINSHILTELIYDESEWGADSDPMHGFLWG